MTSPISSGVPVDYLKEKRNRLGELEKRVQGSLSSMLVDLKEIHDQELWAVDGYKSWAEYCEKRWHWSKQHVNRLLSASNVVENIKQVEPTGSTPATERQARALAKAPPEKQAAAWQTAQADSGTEHPTAKACAAAVAKVTGRKVSPQIEQLADSVAGSQPDEGDDADQRPKPDDEPEDEPGIRTADEERADLTRNVREQISSHIMSAINIAHKTKEHDFATEFLTKAINIINKWKV